MPMTSYSFNSLYSFVWYVDVRFFNRFSS